MPIFGNRDSEKERSPFAKFTLEPDLSALQFDQILRDAEAQTGSGRFANLLIR